MKSHSLWKVEELFMCSRDLSPSTKREEIIGKCIPEKIQETKYVNFILFKLKTLSNCAMDRQ